MAAYKIYFNKSVEKDFKVIPKKDLVKILERIETLAEDPRPPRCEKLSGQQKYRLRQGRYRILYSVQDDELTIWVVKVGHRKDIYRWREQIAGADRLKTAIFGKGCADAWFVWAAAQLKRSEGAQHR
jgi:mRNA interferase RelE/StbE